MNVSDLKNVILECCNDVLFFYKGKVSGISAEVYDSIPTYQVWHGSDIREYSDIDDLMTDKFFSGKSIIELVGSVDFTIV